MTMSGRSIPRFVVEPSQGLICPLCGTVARDPHQHGKCGKLFCKECLDRYGRDKPCKNCNSPHPEYFEDNRSECYRLRLAFVVALP